MEQNKEEKSKVANRSPELKDSNITNLTDYSALKEQRDDLLKAIEECENYIDCPYPHVYETLNKAIAKAKGAING